MKENINNNYSRAPIISILGHVNHGKTSILKKILSINIKEKRRYYTIYKIFLS